MPISPFQHVLIEPSNQVDSRSTAGSGRAKRKPKPTSAAKNRKKKIKARYAKAREEAQLAGIIATTPDGAVRDERVPSTLGPALPEIVRMALRESWATPDAAKPQIIAALLEPFYVDDVIIDEGGNAIHVKPSRKMLNELAKTLCAMDKTQWDRDRPEGSIDAERGPFMLNVNVVTVESKPRPQLIEASTVPYESNK